MYILQISLLLTTLFAFASAVPQPTSDYVAIMKREPGGQCPYVNCTPNGQKCDCPLPHGPPAKQWKRTPPVVSCDGLSPYEEKQLGGCSDDEDAWGAKSNWEQALV